MKSFSQRVLLFICISFQFWPCVLEWIFARVLINLFSSVGSSPPPTAPASWLSPARPRSSAQNLADRFLNLAKRKVKSLTELCLSGMHFSIFWRTKTHWTILRTTIKKTTNLFWSVNFMNQRKEVFVDTDIHFMTYLLLWIIYQLNTKLNNSKLFDDI